MNKYGIAVIGAGMVVDERHLPGLAKTGVAEPRSVFDPHKERAAALAAKFEIGVNASRLEEAIDRDDVDAVLIASPNKYHRVAAECAFAAGKHVFCEKPIATTLADSRAICDAAENSGKLLHLGFHHRFNAEHVCVKRLIDEGILGEVRAFHSVVSEPIEVVPHGTDNYRFNLDAGGGLPLVDVGSHRIDQARALLGEVAEDRAGGGSRPIDTSGVEARALRRVPGLDHHRGPEPDPPVEHSPDGGSLLSPVVGPPPPDGVGQRRPP